jgi:hypothetical protein
MRTRFALLVAIFLAGISSVLVLRADPNWWTNTTTGTNITVANTTVNNYAPLNIGQLKYVATKAALYLNLQLSSLGGAGAAVNSTVAFSINSTADFSPANLGQLKAVAQPFYNRLLVVGYNTTLNLRNNGYSSTWTLTYPWDPGSPTAFNYEPANLGQLKLVFSFDLTGFTATDSDGDGVPDASKSFMGVSTGLADTDGDGIDDGSDVLPLDPSFYYLPSVSTALPQITLTAPTDAVRIY